MKRWFFTIQRKTRYYSNQW